jgi:paraquat-inducible protein A
MKAMPHANAQAAGLARCRVCGLLARMPKVGAGAACRRCGTELTYRKRRSLERTWAYLVSAYILYIPANVLPIMHTESLVQRRDDTIFSGVIYLWSVHSYMLAVVVFVASITVPLVKLVVLTVLAVSVKHPSSFRRIERARAYRIVESIGRWSMLDVYVAALLTSLVHQQVAVISVGPAAFAFTAVVITTLMASRAFDARLLWDSAEAQGLDDDASERGHERGLANG